MFQTSFRLVWKHDVVTVHAELLQNWVHALDFLHLNAEYILLHPLSRFVNIYSNISIPLLLRDHEGCPDTRQHLIIDPHHEDEDEFIT